MTKTIEDECWDAAFTEFREKLTRDKRKIELLDRSKVDKHAFVSFEELKRTTRRAYDECYSERRPLFKSLGRALQAADQYAPVIDVMVQAQPFAVNLVWGSIRFLIEACAAETAVSPEINAGLEKLIRHIPRYLAELKVCCHSPGVVTATSAVLAQTICYLVNAKHFLLRSPIKRASKAAFSTKLAFILGELKSRNEDLDREIRAAHGMMQAGINQAVSRMITNDFSQTVIAWSQAGPVEAHSVDPNHLREPGTCEWILEHPVYIEWNGAGCAKSLCIQGIVGCGKSVLAVFLAQRLDAEIPVLKHSFHGARETAPVATARFALALLRQLLIVDVVRQDHHFPPLLEKAACLARQFPCALECPVSTLLEVVENLLDLIPSFAVIIDALDQCAHQTQVEWDDFTRLLSYIQKIAVRKGARVIILSRSGSFAKDDFGDATHLCMGETCTASDIRRFVAQEIGRNCGRNPGLRELKDYIINKVSDGCHGMFLWARFIMASLRTAETTNDILRTLNEFPCALAEIYQKQLDKIDARLRGNERQKVRQREIFLLLAGAHKTLTTHDISDFLALNVETNVSEQSERIRNPAAAILNLCEPLVTVVGEQLQFAHASAKEFILQKVIPQEESDAFLACKCLSRLSQSQYSVWTYPARLLRQNLLSGLVGLEASKTAAANPVSYEYACLHWQDHVTAVKDPSDSLLRKLVNFMLGNEFVTWSESLFQLKSNASIGPQIQVRARLSRWREDLPTGKKEKVPIHEFFVNAHESIYNEFQEKGEDSTLIYLPYIRLGLYYNVGGQKGADFYKAYEYKMTVVVRYEAALGRRNPLTLRSKTELFKEFFFQKRFDEAEMGLKEVAEVQREVVGDDVVDLFLTVQILGSAHYCVTNFDLAITALADASSGFRRLSGENNVRALVCDMSTGWALERMSKTEEACRIYSKLLDTWIPIGGPQHPFSLMLKTSLGSAFRKLARFQESKVLLMESLQERRNLFGIEAEATVDVVLEVAALSYDSGDDQQVQEYLNLIWDVGILKTDFERRCIAEYLLALEQFDSGLFERPRATLEKLLQEASGEGRDRNNRSLLMVRPTLADVLRQHGEEDEALMVFSDLIVPTSINIVRAVRQEDPGYRFPSSLTNEPEPPAQLAIAELALRFVKVAKTDEADKLLHENNLRWRRKQDFWVMQGGPITDTASLRDPNLPDDYHFCDLPICR